MKILLDSGIWYRSGINALSAAMASFIADADEVWLCPVSVQEIVYKATHGKLACPPPDQWLPEALAGCRLAPITFASAQQAGVWPWAHRDPFDRLIAAVAKTENLTLVHTDRVLRDLTGFPQKYFRATH